MGIPPLATLFFLYLGFKFRGIAGMIIAVPVGILFIRFYGYGAFDGLIRNVFLQLAERDWWADGRIENKKKRQAFGSLYPISGCLF